MMIMGTEIGAMTAITSVEPQVRLAQWAAEHSPELIAGSIFSVGSSVRWEAAQLLKRSGHGVHADILFHPDGTLGGVRPDELRMISAELPDTRIDIHLIDARADKTSGWAGRDDLLHRAAVEILKLAAEVNARWVTVVQELLQEVYAEPAGVLARQIDLLRRSGTRVWTELAPGQELDENLAADGSLIMLIPPGTVSTADWSQLEKIRTVASTGLPVGVDGGVDGSIARQALAAGATHVISGRGLLEGASDRSHVGTISAQGKNIGPHTSSEEQRRTP